MAQHVTYFLKKKYLKGLLEQPYATQIADAMNISGTYLNDKELNTNNQ